jgi:hypothetical protein
MASGSGGGGELGKCITLACPCMDARASAPPDSRVDCRLSREPPPPPPPPSGEPGEPSELSDDPTELGSRASKRRRRGGGLRMSERRGAANPASPSPSAGSTLLRPDAARRFNPRHPTCVASVWVVCRAVNGVRAQCKHAPVKKCRILSRSRLTRRGRREIGHVHLADMEDMARSGEFSGEETRSSTDNVDVDEKSTAGSGAITNDPSLDSRLSTALFLSLSLSAASAGAEPAPPHSDGRVWVVEFSLKSYPSSTLADGVCE